MHCRVQAFSFLFWGLGFRAYGFPHAKKGLWFKVLFGGVSNQHDFGVGFLASVTSRPYLLLTVPVVVFVPKGCACFHIKTVPMDPGHHGSFMKSASHLRAWTPPQTFVRVVTRRISLRWTLHPVVVTMRDNRDYIRVLLYSYYTTITGWGVLLRNPPAQASYTARALVAI